MDIDDLCKLLGTSLIDSSDHSKYFGLTDLQANQKLAHYGKNKLTEKKRLPCIVRYLLVHTGLFNVLLWIGSALCFLVYGI